MENIARLIDHTLLRADARVPDIQRLCHEAARYGFRTVCVNPYFVDEAKTFLKGASVGVCTVVGFPLGMGLTAARVCEAKACAEAGADELDIVMNIGAARDGLWEMVEKDLAEIISATAGAVRKVIIETCYLTDDEKKTAAKTVVRAGAEFVKTSTGYGPGGATVEDVRLIKGIVGDRAGIKASGGIKTLEQTMEMVEAGATRIGTSSGVAIMEGK